MSFPNAFSEDLDTTLCIYRNRFLRVKLFSPYVVSVYRRTFVTIYFTSLLKKVERAYVKNIQQTTVEATVEKCFAKLVL